MKKSIERRLCLINECASFITKLMNCLVVSTGLRLVYYVIAMKTSILTLLIDKKRQKVCSKRVKYDLKCQLFVDVMQIHDYYTKYASITTKI